MLNEFNHSDNQEPERQWHVKIRHSMQAKMMLAFVLVFILTFAGSGIIAVYGLPFGYLKGWQGNAQEQAIRNLNLVADMQKDHLLSWFRARLADGQVIVENESVRDNLAVLVAHARTHPASEGNGEAARTSLAEKQARNRILNYLSSTKKAYAVNRIANYGAIWIVEPRSGRVIVSTDIDRTGTSSEHPGTVTRVIRSGASVISDVNIDGGANTGHLAIGHPIYDTADLLLGVVLLQVSMEEVSKMIRNSVGRFGSIGEILLVDGDRHILTPLQHPLEDGSQARVMEYKIAAQAAALAAAGQEGTVASEDYRGHAVIAAYRHIRISPYWGWGLVVKVDKDRLFASISESLKLSTKLGIAGIFLIIILSFCLTRQITRPLSRITKIAGRLAAGSEYESTRIKRNDEIGVLASVFDEMAGKLDASNRSLLRRTADLDAANSELESFAYSIAHDLRAPLRAIDGFSQALYEDYGQDLHGEAATYLGYLREGAQEMGRLIDDLLKLSRVTRGTMTDEDVDLSRMAIEILDALKKAEPERNVKTDVAPGLVVRGDPRLLRVVLDNLLDNAWKFTARETQAQIDVRVDRKNGKYRCVISDNGVGFDMRYKDKLFKPFQRLHSNVDFKGTGIGLVTVQRILNRHGGSVLAKGVVGEGASFEFELDAGGHHGT